VIWKSRSLHCTCGGGAYLFQSVRFLRLSKAFVGEEQRIEEVRAPIAPCVASGENVGFVVNAARLQEGNEVLEFGNQIVAAPDVEIQMHVVSRAKAGGIFGRVVPVPFGAARPQNVGHVVRVVFG